MHTRIENRGSKNQVKLFIASITKEANEHSRGSVSHAIGTEKVTVRSTSHSYGAAPVEGRENIKLLRDAMIEICKKMGIN